MVRVVLLVVALLPACVGIQTTGSQYLSLPARITGKMNVAGTVIVRGTSKVMPGAILTVRPGTTFLFEPLDEDGDGVNDSRLVVEGVLSARGTPESPITFTSSSPDPVPGDWLEIRVDRSSGTVFEHCIVEYSRYGLHSHFSSGIVADSIFRNNIDGTRFGRSRYYVLNNRFENNLGKGINLRQSPLLVRGNIISGNRHGIFFFEKGKGAVIAGNSFVGNIVSDVRFGDFFTGELPRFGKNIKQGGSGLLLAGPADILKEMPALIATLPDAGHIGPGELKITFEKLWERPVGGFIDAAPFTIPGGRIGVATWDGEIVQVAEADGSILSRTNVGDVVDATPILFKDWIFFPAWDRRIRRVDLTTGKVDGMLKWSPSLADDHRQGDPSVMRSGSKGWNIMFGLWNGEAASLDPVTMRWVWRTQLDGPIRTGAVSDGINIWLGTDEGTVYALDSNGRIIREVSLKGRVRAKPAVLGSDDLAVSTWDGRVARLKGGRVLWEKKLNGKGTYAGPISVKSPGETIAAADGSGSVYLMDNEGVLLWRIGLGSAVHTLSLTGRILWAGTQAGDLFAIKLSTGRVLGRLQAGGAVHGRPLHKSGIIVFGSRDGVLRAYKETVMEAPWEWS